MKKTKLNNFNEPNKTSEQNCHSHDQDSSSHACTRRYVYILSIKRSIYKSLEIIGVYTNISKAKKIVQNNFNNYKSILEKNKTPENEMILSKIADWKYSNKKWEHSKQDKRFYFYALSQDLNSFYQIVKLELDDEDIRNESNMCN